MLLVVNAFLEIKDTCPNKQTSIELNCKVNPINWVGAKQWGWATLGSVSRFKIYQSEHWKFPVEHETLKREGYKAHQHAIMY